MTIAETVAKMQKLVLKEGTIEEVHGMRFFGMYPEWVFEKVKKENGLSKKKGH